MLMIHKKEHFCIAYHFHKFEHKIISQKGYICIWNNMGKSFIK